MPSDSSRISENFLYQFKFFIAFILLVVPNVVYAQLSIEWDASPSPGVDGYIVYYGKQSGNYTDSVDVGNTTSCVISDLEEGRTYYFAATAYYKNNSDYLEGSPSTELRVDVPASPVPTTDSDGDGISDDDELNVYGTDPQNTDTDDDGFSDGIEIDNGYDPMDPNSKPAPVMIWLEAEDGVLMSPVEVAWDENTSSGGYIVVPNGNGSV